MTGGGVAAMAAMGLITALLAPALVLLTRHWGGWQRVALPAPAVLAGFVLLHAGLSIGMTQSLPVAVMAVAKPLLLAGAVAFWLPVYGPESVRLSGAGRCVYLFIAAPALDLAAVVIVGMGHASGGLAMMVAMLPVGVAALQVTWQWITAEERQAAAAEAAAGPADRHRPRTADAAAGAPADGAAGPTGPAGWAGRRGGAADRNHDRGAPVVTRRLLQLGLAALWLSAAALQAQPFMFTAAFSRRVLLANAPGQPAPLAELVRHAAGVVAAQPASWNISFVAVQAALGLGLLYRGTVRIALYGSIAWALGVWTIGEGLGGLFTGGASVLMGAPGAAAVYGLLAAAALPPRRHDHSAGAPPAWLPVAWAAVWLIMLLSGPWPGQTSAGMLRHQLAGPSPGVLSAIAADAASHPLLCVATLAAAQSLIALGALAGRRWRTAAAAAGAVVAVLAWLTGEAFGGLATGQATDVNTGPPLVLLALGLWAAARRPAGPRRARTRARAAPGLVADRDAPHGRPMAPAGPAALDSAGQHSGAG